MGSRFAALPADRTEPSASRSPHETKAYPRKAARAGSLKDLRAVRELLRQFGASDRLRRERIESRYATPRDRERIDTMLTSSSEELIRSAIGDLPSRIRIVLERTELGGESVADVACALTISERQVYRDRAIALKRIAQRLVGSSQDSAQTSSVYSNADAALCHASMLEQVGQLDLAAVVLLDIASASADPRDRASTYCALARLALEQGNTGAARSHAERAISNAMATNGDVLARCEADAVLGEIALWHGRSAVASQMLRRSCAGLRSLLFGPRHDRAAEALARGLLSLSQSYDLCGTFEKARDAADEARLCLEDMCHTSAQLSLEARARIATSSHFIGESAHHWESELRACYDASLKNGFILLALDVAVTLATFYRLRGATNLAHGLLEPLVMVCKNVATSRTKAIYYASFATVLSSNGDAKLADEMLDAFRATLPPQPDLEALFYLVATRTKLAAGSPLEAIDASMKAQLVLSELGRTGLIGVSLHLRSLALAALGQDREALQTARDAVEALSAGHPRARKLAQETLSCLRSGGVQRLRASGRTSEDRARQHDSGRTC